MSSITIILKKKIVCRVAVRLWLVVFAFIGMWYAVPYVHEMAHALVCEWSGRDAEIHIIFTGEARTTFCSGPPFSIPLYYAIGGLAGAGFAGVLAVSKHKVLQTIALPFIPANLVQTALETYAHRWYVNPENYIPMSLSSGLVIGLFLVLLWKNDFLKPREEQARASYSTD